MKIGRPETALSAFHCGSEFDRHARVDLVLAIGGAGEAGFAARRGAAVGRALCVDQRHSVTLLLQMMRGPGAEHARADDCDMLLHCALVGLRERWRNGSAARSEEERAARYFEYCRRCRLSRAQPRSAAAAAAEAAAPGRRRSPGSPIRPGRSASPEAAAAAVAAAEAAAALRRRSHSNRQPDLPRLADQVAEAGAQAAFAIDRQLGFVSNMFLT